MAQLWDANMAARAAAIEQAQKLGGVIVQPPKRTGFHEEPQPERDTGPSPLPGQPDESY